MTDYDVEVMAKTVYGEARGEGEEGMEAVACVIMNRFKAQKWFTGYRERCGIKIPDIAATCLKPRQFSCWNRNDPNFELLHKVDERDQVFAYCLDLAARTIDGRLEDFTNNATFYHNRTNRPKWAAHKSPCYETGNYLFYNDIK
jgi:hypothetical protein